MCIRDSTHTHTHTHTRADLKHAVLPSKHVYYNVCKIAFYLPIELDKKKYVNVFPLCGSDAMYTPWIMEVTASR